MFEKIKNIFYDLSDLFVTILIIAVIVVSISLIMSSSIGIDFQKQLKDIERVSTTTEQKEPTKQNVEKPVKEANDPTVKKQPTTSTNDNTNSVTSNQENQAKPKEESKPVEKKPVANEQKSKSVVITYPAGEPLQNFAKNLQEQKVIDSSDAFIALLVEQELDTLVQPGEYTFTTQSTPAEVIKILFPNQQ